MKTHPEVLTEEHVAKMAHIPTDEVLRDIADTEAEIAEYRRLQKAERLMADSYALDSATRRMASFRASVRVEQIAEREVFVAFLRRLLDARGAEGAPEVPRG